MLRQVPEAAEVSVAGEKLRTQQSSRVILFLNAFQNYQEEHNNEMQLRDQCEWIKANTRVQVSFCNIT